ncbi:efflux RND transporter periplasmic adaptor subunit [Rhodocyclus tenuis]|uniref:RND family efflux transporter MFP subunit n=1 Tax=Rhodocyclus tenuis TaxID=1066 RepID=A0A840FZ34_RHOTE|nr:efflux RND transporter periplasmic adaptor subunit [Rhodocyclus tenuis]MBB4247144.1 RND family efflux transporter MFP subunit [Rhodocyclus tenuis]
MKSAANLVIGAVLLAVLAAAGGYWLGNQGAERASSSVQTTVPAGAAATPERKILYYRNPMGLPDTSPTPKKDPMGMDYLPVYADAADEDEKSGGGAAAAGQIRISSEKLQKLGVRSEAASRRALERSVRAAGRIEADERRLHTITAKFEGYVERLHVSTTGQAVARGQALFEVYSPELVSAQREYTIASEAVTALGSAGGDARSGMQQLAEASLLRLKNWDISEAQVKALARSGETRRTLSFRSPVSGIVTEKKAVQGMRFLPGDVLFQVADLSAVWVVADIAEQDIGLIKTGARAQLRIDAYPDKVFSGTVGYVYPTLNSETRTVPVRVELANPGMLLKPGMFAEVELALAARDKAVTVPLSAVIDSGTRRVVLIDSGEGRFVPREVKLGAHSESFVEVLDGVREGERVVVAANFLIDAESNLQAALSGFGKAGAGKPAPGEAAAGKAAAVPVANHAEGRVDSVDDGSGAVTISHGPVPSLKWPAMTMEFVIANDALRQHLKPGASLSFEFVERGPGEWVITGVKPATVAPSSTHAGH